MTVTTLILSATGAATAGRAVLTRSVRCALNVIQLQGPDDGVQHVVGDAGGVPALQPGAVLDRDPRQQRHFLPGAAPAPAGRCVEPKVRLLGGDLERGG